MNIALFDTNIVIDALNGIEQADTEYQRYQRVYLSLITWMEVMVGVDDSDTLTAAFLQNYFIVLPITRDIAEQAVIVRRQNKIKLPDAIIKATAQVHSALLVTRFLEALSTDIESLKLYGGIHPVFFEGYHRLLSKRFPFAVYYKIENEEIRVYAVVDCRKNPAWIR